MPINTTCGEDIGSVLALDIIRPIARAERETLLLFCRVILCVGGSLLSIGSAVSVALMGRSRGMYTLFDQLKWRGRPRSVMP